MAEGINKTYTSNSLYNDSTGVIAFAEQLKQELINWANYQHVTEELGQNRPDLQSELNNLFLSVYERFLTFLNDADASEEAINTWKEIENFLADYTDEKTLASIVAELNNKIESRLAVPLESTTGSSTTSTMTQKAITEAIDASKTFTTGEKVDNIGIDSEPTASSDNLVKSGGVQNELVLGAVYDVSAKNPTAGPNNDGKWESLSALLSDANLNTLIPTSVRKGGMSIKFVQSSDNKYVVYFLPKDEWSANAEDWEKLNLEEEGENLLVYKMQENAVLSNTGTINPNGTGYITTIDYIPVEPGEVYSNSIEGGYFLKFCFYDENKTFISVDTEKMSFTTPNNAAFVRISFRMIAGHYMLAKSSTPVPYMHPSVISGYVDPLERDQQETASKVGDIVSGMSLITDATATETEGKYVKFSTGAITSGSYGYKIYTYPRSVFGQAQIVRAFVAGRDDVPAAIAFYSATPSIDTYIGGMQMRITERLPGWYDSFIPENAEFVIVTNAGDYNAVPAVHFVEDKLISRLPDYSYFASVAKDTDETASATITNDYYVQYDIGSLVQSGVSAAMQTLQLPIIGSVAIIRAYTATRDDVPAVIAFYSGEPSSSTYIKSSSIQSSSPFNEGKWYEASVPANAKYVIISNRYAIVVSPKIEFVKIPALDPINSELQKKVNFSANPFWNQQFYSHFNPIGLMEDGYGRRLIAGESLDDIRVASRLGFDIIEANLQETSDGVIIVTHGQNGFGPAFIDTRTGEQPTGSISDYSYADVLAYIRYNSALDKYKTPPPTLDEFLICCKKNGIGIMLGVTVLTAENAETAILKARKVLNDKIIVYTGGNAPTQRRLFPGYFFRWFNNSNNTYNQIVDEMNSVGTPAICSLGPTTISVLKSADTFENLVNYLHQNGFLWGTAYASEDEEREYIENGCDLIASTHEVNHFDGNALVVDINDDTPQFVLVNATLSNGVITMSDGGTLTIGTTDKVALGKGMLKIVFNGTLQINFGAIGTRTITSDGSKEIVISDYFLIRKEQLTITASGSAVISNLVYETSRC